jgi:hypothetical protein
MTDVPLLADLEADLGPTSLNAVVPAEFTADAVVVVTDRVRPCDLSHAVSWRGLAG